MVRSAVVGAPMTDLKAPTADTPDLPLAGDTRDLLLAANPDLPTPADPPDLPLAADTPDLPRPAKPDFAPVIRSKVQPPALRADTLTRERLSRRLDEALA